MYKAIYIFFKFMKQSTKIRVNVHFIKIDTYNRLVPKKKKFFKSPPHNSLSIFNLILLLPKLSRSYPNE